MSSITQLSKSGNSKYNVGRLTWTSKECIQRAIRDTGETLYVISLTSMSLLCMCMFMAMAMMSDKLKTKKKEG